jgi:hypothetical protein
MRILQILLSLIFGFGLLYWGRWIQLHPEKLTRQGSYAGVNTFGARLFRAQVLVMGVGLLFGGTFLLLGGLAYLVFRSDASLWAVGLPTIITTTIGAFRIRAEVKKQPPYRSTSPHGWWP